MTAVPMVDTRPTAQSELRLVWAVFAMLVLFLGWAWFFPLVEVSSGQGKVVPSSREQVIQSLDGGIVASLSVKEGDLVERDQIIARLDPTRSASNVSEAAAKYHASIAAAARLRAELDEREAVTFPQELSGESFAQLRANEEALFRSRRTSLRDALSGLTTGLKLTRQELEISEKLRSSGAASQFEVIKLRRDAAQTELEIARLRADARVKVGEDLQKVNAEAEVQVSIMRGRSDQLERLIFRAPRPVVGGEIGPNRLPVGLNLDVQSDLLQGGALTAKANIARNQLAAAEAKLGVVKLEDSVMERGLLRALAAGAQKTAMLHKQIDLLSQTRKLYRSQYFDMGTRRLSELLDNEEEYYARQAELAALRSDLAAARISCAVRGRVLRLEMGVDGNIIYGFPLGATLI